MVSNRDLTNAFVSYCGDTSTNLFTIFRIIGTPSMENWPENASLEKNYFCDYPPVCLKSLMPKLGTDGSDLLTVRKKRIFSKVFHGIGLVISRLTLLFPAISAIFFFNFPTQSAILVFT